jgi:hypothetical protein
MSAMTATKVSMFTRLTHSLRKAAAAFFKSDLAIKRADDGVRIVLRERPAPGKAAAPSREELAARRQRQELTLMQAQLAELLSELPETRQALRQLAFVEQALAKKGLKALHKLPLDVLHKALEQLEGLVTNWSPVGLASLRSKMAVAIIDREHMDPEAEADAYRTAAVLDNKPAEAVVEEERSDDEALAAAYAALGSMAPAAAVSAVEMQGELASPAARAMQREAARPFAHTGAAPDSISLRELQN